MITADRAAYLLDVIVHITTTGDDVVDGRIGSNPPARPTSTTTIYDRRRQSFGRDAADVVVAFVAGG